jgi:hypothetical protein
LIYFCLNQSNAKAASSRRTPNKTIHRVQTIPSAQAISEQQPFASEPGSAKGVKIMRVEIV